MVLTQVQQLVDTTKLDSFNKSKSDSILEERGEEKSNCLMNEKDDIGIRGESPFGCDLCTRTQKHEDEII